MMFHNKFKKPITKSTVSQEEQEIKKILNTEYYGLLHDLMMDGNIENIIQNNPKRLKEVDDLKRYLEYTDIPIEAVSAIYHYSVSNQEMSWIRNGHFSKEFFIDDVYNNLRIRLSSIYPKEVYDMLLEKIKTYYSNYDFSSKNYNDITSDALDLSKELDIPPHLLTEMVYNINKLERAQENNRILDTLLANHDLKIIDTNKDGNFVEKDEIILYRAVNSRFLKKQCQGDLTQLTGQSVKNNFPTSTSKDYDRSFCHRKNCDFIFEIKVPKGSKGIDMEALSEYGTAESEVLLAQNEFLIEKVEYREDNRGQMKYFAECTLIQKELTKENTNEQENKEIDEYEGR